MTLIYRETCRALKLYSPLRQGDAVVSRGAVRCFVRYSNAWIPDAGDGRIVQLSPDQEPITASGLLFENGETNNLLRSSFISGTTGLTLSAGSGTIAVDSASPLLFDTSITPQGLRLTAGNPHVTETRVTWPAVSLLTGAPKTRLWVDHCDRDGTTLYWRLQRAPDSKWWRDSDQTWQVAQTDNALSITPTTSRIVQDRSSVIAVGSSTSVTLSIVLPAGGTASRRNTVYHVQLADDAGICPALQSRIVTNAAAVTRSQSQTILRNLDLNAQAGTLLLKYRTWADAANAPVTLYLARLGGNSGAAGTRELRWSTTTGWNAVAIGGPETAKLAGTPAVDQSYRLAMRWTGAAGELGLAPYTTSIFADGVKGTDAVSGGLVDITAHPTLQLAQPPLLGGAGGIGVFEAIELWAGAKSDEWIAAWGV